MQINSLMIYLICILLLQPLELTEALEYSNIVFSILFATEMVLKLVAFGPFGYIKNGFNVFDGFIVILR